MLYSLQCDLRSNMFVTRTGEQAADSTHVDCTKYKLKQRDNFTESIL